METLAFLKSFVFMFKAFAKSPEKRSVDYVKFFWQY